MNKIIFCVSILVISFCIGLHFVKKEKSHCETLDEINKFIDYLKININFSQKKKKVLFDEYLKNCKSTLKNLQNNKKNINISQIELKKLETMCNIFGTSSLDGENVNLEKTKLEFEQYKIEAEQKYKKTSALAIKLSLLLGLVLCILII